MKLRMALWEIRPIVWYLEAFGDNGHTTSSSLPQGCSYLMPSSLYKHLSQRPSQITLHFCCFDMTTDEGLLASTVGSKLTQANPFLQLYFPGVVVQHFEKATHIQACHRSRRHWLIWMKVNPVGRLKPWRWHGRLLASGSTVEVLSLYFIIDWFFFWKLTKT